MSKVAKFGTHLKELRIHLCQKGASSKGVRDFIENNYVSLKSFNPGTPILIRECSNVEPRLCARFETGKESSVTLTNLSATDVLNKLKILAK